MYLWKERLNSDGQQFHQYPQNEHSPLTFTMTYDVRNPGSGLGQAQKIWRG